jgi:hypothetical protein
MRSFVIVFLIRYYRMIKSKRMRWAGLALQIIEI